MKPILTGNEILELIPQRPPIVMVDVLYGVEENISYSGLTIQEDNLFCEKGIFQEAGIIEHIAQSAAVRVGYICRQKNEPVPIGFIASVDKLTIHFLPQSGHSLVTMIEVLHDFSDFTLISAQVKSNEKIVAECNMKIFLSENEKA